MFNHILIMGSFLKYSFATVFGILLFVIVAFLLMAGVGFFASRKSATKVKPNSIMSIKFDYPISDRSKTSAPSFSSFSFDDTKIGLNDILANIEKAQNDDRIKGIYLDLSSVTVGLGIAEEIRGKLLKFRESGKFIIAYSEVMTQKAYYLASVADKIYLNPKGVIALQGFSTELTFFKEALDRLGIQPEIFYAGNFKSATEPLRYTKMSDYNRLQTRALLDDFYQSFVAQTAIGRKMSPEKLNDIIDNLRVRNAEDAKANGIVDDLFYYDQVQAELHKQTGIKEDKDLEFVSIEKYTTASDPKKKATKKDKIAILYAEGSIADGEGDESNIASADYIKHIQDIRKDKDVKALVLRVNSGGGSALASEIIWRELELLKKQGIPIIASMGDVAASGGYYICANADTIVAQPNTVTGSIGVFGVFAELGDFYKSKLGMTFDTVKTTRHSDFPTSPLLSHPFNEEDKAIVQKGVDEIYQSFLKRVSDGRKMPIDKVQEIAQGRVWTGTQAKQNGLVDVLGGVEDAIKLAAKRAGLAEGTYSVAQFPEQEDKFTKLLKNFGMAAKQSAVDAELQKQLGSQYKYYLQLRALSQLNGIQARMPFELEIK